jgi:hypothetical protein
VGTLIGLGVLFFGAGFLIRSGTTARNAAWTGPRTDGMRRRARSPAAGQRPVRHEIRLARVNAQLADWLKERDHARRNGGGSAGRPPAVTTRGRARAAATATLRRLGQPRPASGNGNGSAPAASQPPPPARPAPAPSTDGSPGRTATVAAGTSTGSVEKLIEGVNQISAEAAAGGIHAKQRALKAATEGCIRFAQMAMMLSRSMSEPNSNYGPEITEPSAKAGEHLQAAAMSFGESDTNLTTLLNMSVGELAQSSRQAPHHAELSESGSR